MNSLTHSIDSATGYIQQHCSSQIDSAVILGSGLSDLNLDQYQTIAKFSYSDIPGIPTSTAPSHAGELEILRNESRTVALCAGRQHLYEGYSAQQVSTLIYVLKALGARDLFVTNASGALNSAYQPGDIMLIEDHINFTGQNPLIGQDDSLGMRFPDMSETYNRGLLASASSIATQNKFRHHQGIYLGVTGPSLETSAERRMFRSMGADAVGMSTVVEVIAAKHCGLNVLGLSAITNLALGDADQKADTIEEVLENALIAGKGIKTILQALLT